MHEPLQAHISKVGWKAVPHWWLVDSKKLDIGKTINLWSAGYSRRHFHTEALVWIQISDSVFSSWCSDEKWLLENHLRGWEAKFWSFCLFSFVYHCLFLEAKVSFFVLLLALTYINWGENYIRCYSLFLYISTLPYSLYCQFQLCDRTN